MPGVAEDSAEAETVRFFSSYPCRKKGGRGLEFHEVRSLQRDHRIKTKMQGCAKR